MTVCTVYYASFCFEFIKPHRLASRFGNHFNPFFFFEVNTTQVMAMRLNYKFSNLCGAQYRNGNILFTSDGRSLITPVGNRITVFDLLNHRSQTLRTQARHDIKRIALSPDDKLLVSVDTHGHAAIVNFRKQIVLATMKFKSNNINAIQFSPNGKYLAVGHDNWISVWQSPSLIVEWKPMLLHGKYRGHHGDVLCITWSPDSQFFASGSKDMTAKIHALHKRKPFKSQQFTGHIGPVIAIFFGSDYKVNFKSIFFYYFGVW